MVRWPSGLRRCVQVVLHHNFAVRKGVGSNPTLANTLRALTRDTILVIHSVIYSCFYWFKGDCYSEMLCNFVMECAARILFDGHLAERSNAPV